MEAMFRGEGCHKSVTVGDWSVTVGVVVTVVDITVGEVGITG